MILDQVDGTVLENYLPFNPNDLFIEQLQVVLKMAALTELEQLEQCVSPKDLWKQPSLTFLGKIISELLSLSDPRKFLFVGNQPVWLERTKMAESCHATNVFAQIYQALRLSALTTISDILQRYSELCLVTIFEGLSRLIEEDAYFRSWVDSLAQDLYPPSNIPQHFDALYSSAVSKIFEIVDRKIGKSAQVIIICSDHLIPKC